MDHVAAAMMICAVVLGIVTCDAERMAHVERLACIEMGSCECTCTPTPGPTP